LRVCPFRDIKENFRAFYETEPEKVDQTCREICADLFRVHLLRGGHLIERGADRFVFAFSGARPVGACRNGIAHA
jgi:hypothetical protein